MNLTPSLIDLHPFLGRGFSPQSTYSYRRSTKKTLRLGCEVGTGQYRAFGPVEGSTVTTIVVSVVGGNRGLGQNSPEQVGHLHYVNFKGLGLDGSR